MLEARSGHSATLLADGRVLVAGGFPPHLNCNDDPSGLATAEIFDPAMEVGLRFRQRTSRDVITRPRCCSSTDGRSSSAARDPGRIPGGAVRP